jgi:hypothetical protein
MPLLVSLVVRSVSDSDSDSVKWADASVSRSMCCVTTGTCDFKDPVTPECCMYKAFVQVYVQYMRYVQGCVVEKSVARSEPGLGCRCCRGVIKLPKHPSAFYQETNIGDFSGHVDERKQRCLEQRITQD